MPNVKKDIVPNRYENLLMIYLNSAKESWVVDRFKKEWYEYNKKISTKFISRSNTIWLIAPWTWSKVNSKI